MKFIDLRDQFGITQIIVNDNCADNLVTECVIQVDGTVIERTNKNSKNTYRRNRNRSKKNRSTWNV